MTKTPAGLEIDCLAAHARISSEGFGGLLLDCREQDEYDLVHVADSTLLPMSELARRVDELAPHRDQEILVLCHHGMRSLQVATWLREQGFDGACSIAGGIDAWSCQVDSSLPRY
ncbi:MAG: rhodanese-like domain-containing protein [Planctomycetota bacterium]|nr:rhodanese-like domain-containing protein [Planctomycetota bacterium]